MVISGSRWSLYVRTLVFISFGYTAVYFLLSTHLIDVKSTPQPDSMIDSMQKLTQQVEFLHKSLSRLAARTEQMSCRLQKIGSRGGFCLTSDSMEVGGNWVWDLPMAMEMENIMENKSVGDFGAGLGWQGCKNNQQVTIFIYYSHESCSEENAATNKLYSCQRFGSCVGTTLFSDIRYGRYFQRLRQYFFPTGRAVENSNFFDIPEVDKAMKSPKKILSWKGYDGAVFVEELTGGLVQFLDLSEPVWLPETYDWVISLEVGEHIPQIYEKIYIDNLVRHACEGIILSWAPTNQDGHHHVNNRESSYIKDQLRKRGFIDRTDWEKKLKNASVLYWFKNSLMVYTRHQKSMDSKCQLSNYSTKF